MGQRHCPREYQVWFERTWQQARRYAALASEVHKPRKFALSVEIEDIPGVLLASAYPDRIGRRRPGGEVGVFQLSNGRSARLPPEDSLASKEWLAIAEVGGQQGRTEDRIYSACELKADNFNEALSPLVQVQEIVEWDYQREQFVAECRTMVGRIPLAVEALDNVPLEARVPALLEVVRKKGLEMLPWNDSLSQWRARVQLLHEVMAGEGENPWPDLSEPALLASLEQWLGPYLSQVNRVADFKQLDLKAILQALLPWPLPLDLERLAPQRMAVPSGSDIAIDYGQSPPVLAVKLQEMFGCQETPSVADGRQPLLVHLLSPARRPLQVTQDLAGFWQGSYQDVKREMKGRYPKHPWPDDPLVAPATAHTKRRFQG
jgi:ATP-dependent helicase HrpB